MAYESWKSTFISEKLNAADVVLTYTWTITITTGRIYFINSEQEEWIDFTWNAASQLTWLTRGLSQTADPATWWTGKTWVAWSEFTIVAMHDQLPDKQTNNTFDWNITLTDWKKVFLWWWTNCFVWSDDAWTNLKLKDASNSERTLTELSSLSWSNDKVKVSADDTTEDYLENKVTGWDWISIETTSPWWDEDLDIDIDTSDTTIFVKTSSWAWDEDKAPILNSSGKLVDWFLDTTTFNYLSSTSFTLWEDMTAADVASLRTDGNIYKYDWLSDAWVEYSTDTITSNRTVFVDTSRIVTAYLDNGNSDLHMKAWTISSWTITYWSEVDVDVSMDSTADLSLAKIDTDAWVVFYRDSATVLFWVPFTVSGTTITLWSAVQVNATSTNTSTRLEVMEIDTNKVAFSYWAWATNSRLNARVWTISANVLTLWTEAVIWANESSAMHCGCKLDTDKFLVCYENWWDIKLFANTVSWTTITTWSLTTLTETAATNFSLYQVATDIAMIVYDDTDLFARHITVSGTTVTWQTASTILAATTVWDPDGRPLVQLNSDVYWIIHTNDKITWFNTNSTTFVNSIISTIDYWVVIWASVNFKLSNAALFWTSSFLVNDFSVASKKTYIANFDTHYILWILQETWTASQSKIVSMSWQNSTVHTWLSTWQKYFIDLDWTLTQNPTAFWTVQWQVWMAGKALNTTTLLVNIPYEDLS